jgi:hypothetical protein
MATSSCLTSLRRSGIHIMLLAAPILLASSAYADSISVGFQELGFNGGAITTLGTGGSNVSFGGISYGTFTINDVSAQSRAALGAPGLLNTQSLDISSSTAGILTIYITAQGLSFTGAQNFVSSFAVNALSGSIVGIDESTYFSPTNDLYATGQTLLNSAVFNAIGTSGPTTTSGLTSGLFSVTERYVIFDTGGETGNDNITINLSSTPLASEVPEPGTLLLVGSGLALAGLLYYRRRNKRPCLLISNI